MHTLGADVLRDLVLAMSSPVDAVEPVSGGDINQAFRVTLGDRREVFVKHHHNPPAGMFEREAEGLGWLQEAGAVQLPRVLAVGSTWLALSWVEAGPEPNDFAERLGRSLAALHRAHPDAFGLETDNFIGTLPQSNAPRSSWLELFRDLRILPLARRCAQKGMLSLQVVRRIERLCARLGPLLGDPEPPARLHGDLWSGNVMCNTRGEPVLIDPAVYGGHREIDLAMLRLFGATDPRLFAAYDEAYPLQAGFAERLPLYQLYPLLVHVALFGRSYVAQLEAALDPYVPR